MKLLTPEEVAKILKFSIHTLTKWRQQKKGPPAIKVEGAIRYKEEAFYKWLEEQEKR